MQKQTFSVLFFIRRTKLLKTGETPIQMRLTLCGQNTEIQLPRRIKPTSWNQKKERTPGKDPVSIEINRYLDSVRTKIYSIQREIEEELLPITLKEIKDRFSGKKQREQFKYFFQLFQDEIDRMESLVGKDFAKITVNRYKLCLRYFKEMLNLPPDTKEDILLRGINKNLILQFDAFLKVKKHCSQNTVVRYMKCLKKITNMGIANGWITRNPFFGTVFKQQSVKVDTLTIAEIRLIYNKQFSIPRLERVRDIYVFCCFTGLAFIDVSTLREEHIVIDEAGNKWIDKDRVKTGVSSLIPLTEIPLAILEKYKNDPCHGKGLLLPVYVNQKMNSYLKEIADFCGIKKRLTTHTARHTFATQLVANHVTLKNVSTMMGHTSTKMTERYVKSLDMSILNDMQMVEQQLQIAI